MSADSGNLLGCYTELEIAAGIASLVDGRDPGDSEDKGDRTFNAYKQPLNNLEGEERRQRIIKKLAALSIPSEIKAETIRLLIKDEIDYIIYRYGKKERLPEKYLVLIKEPDFLSSLIKGFLLKFLKMEASSELVREVNFLTERLRANPQLETPYDRVSEIQSYIHRKAISAHGDNADRMLPKSPVRILLSCARLNLSIQDLNRNAKAASCNRFLYGNLTNNRGHSVISYFEYVFRKSELSADLESKYPTIGLPVNGRYIPNWNVRFKKPISYYCRQSTRSKIENIEKLIGENQPTPDENIVNAEKVKKECTEIYCTN